MTPEQAELYSKLTDLQKAVANAYIATGEAATYGEAYLAGCAEIGKKPGKNARQNGEQILSNTDVAAYVEAVKNPRQEAEANAAIASREEILEFFTNIVRTPALVKFKTINVLDPETCQIEEQTIWHLPETEEMTEAQRKAIAGIVVGKDGKVEIKQHDPMAAAKAIADIQGYKVAPKAPVDGDGNTVDNAPKVIIDPELYKAARAKVLDDDI